MAVQIPASLEALSVPIGDVSAHPANARRHADALLRDSLAEHGQYRPLVVQRSTGYVLAGNGTLAAASASGWTDIAVTYVDVNDEEARRILAVDNRTTDLGGYDDTALAALLASLPDLSGTGYDLDFLDDLQADLGAFTASEPAGLVLPPAPTGAHYAESDEDLQARREHYDVASSPARRTLGVREMILAMSFDDYDASVECLALLRAHPDALPAPDALPDDGGDGGGGGGYGVRPTTGGRLVRLSLEAYIVTLGIQSAAANSS